jgi:uncharacterized protein (DUF486 family)
LHGGSSKQIWQRSPAAQLKTIQEVITLLVFTISSIVYLKSPPTWGQGFGFLLIAVGAFFVFQVPK